MHVHLPQLPLDEARRLRRGAPWRGPVAVVAKQGAAMRLSCVGPQAQEAGLSCGMSLSDARAIVPGLETVAADPAADARCLEGLADACRRYTPAVALDAPDGLWLEIGGGAHLFGGEAALAADLVAYLQGKGFQVRFAVGDTPGLAAALSAFRPGCIAPPGTCEEALGPLPPSALRLDEADSAVMARLGVRTIAKLQSLRRASVARRLGERTLERLDEALGLRSTPLLTRLEAAPHQAQQRLAEPVCNEAAVLDLTRVLATRLLPRLEGERLGGRRFRLDLFRVDGAVRRLCVDCSRPLRDPPRIAALFAERVATLNEGLEADYGFDLLRLTAEHVDRLEPHTPALAPCSSAPADLAGFVDRVNARYGAGRVVRLAPEPRTRIPEAAVRAVGVSQTALSWAEQPRAVEDGALLRPLRLLAPPEEMAVVAAEAPEGAPAQFRWRRVLRRVVKAEGPERLASEWWREGASALTRDYYRLEDTEGRRYWAFRQGLYDEVEQPRWFVHGLFP